MLILACSKRKCSHPHLLPAIDRYDGPAYRVLRRYIQDEAPRRTDIYILSAEYGLFSADQPIPTYNRRMTPKRARQLRPSALEELSKALNKGYHELLICAGQTYRQALEGYDRVIPSTIAIHTTTGPLGRQLSQLHDWLNGSPPHHNVAQSTTKDGWPRIRGVEIQATPTDALSMACKALDVGTDGLDSYQSWYVPIGNRRVAPKWLVSQLSGLPVSVFTTGEALRLLAQLGVAVERV